MVNDVNRESSIVNGSFRVEELGIRDLELGIR
jgi:hypothetical protein